MQFSFPLVCYAIGSFHSHPSMVVFEWLTFPLSYFGGPGSKYRRGEDHPEFSYFYSVPLCESRYSTLKMRSPPLSSKSFPIHQLLVALFYFYYILFQLLKMSRKTKYNLALKHDKCMYRLHYEYILCSFLRLLLSLPQVKQFLQNIIPKHRYYMGYILSLITKLFNIMAQ